MWIVNLGSVTWTRRQIKLLDGKDSHHMGIHLEQCQYERTRH